MSTHDLIDSVQAAHLWESHIRSGEWLYRRCTCGVEMQEDEHPRHLSEELVAATIAEVADHLDKLADGVTDGFMGAQRAVGCRYAANSVRAMTENNKEEQ